MSKMQRGVTGPVGPRGVKGFLINNEFNVCKRNVIQHVTHRHYASVHHENHNWARFDRVTNVHQRRYEAVLSDHMHLFMPDRSTHLNVRRTEAIFEHSDQYSHFTRNVSNFLRRTEAVHTDNQYLHARQNSDLAERLTALEVAVRTAQTQMAEIMNAI
jgi:hypothetical protein